MADDDEYVKRGRAIVSGGGAATPDTDDDYVKRGRAITAAPVIQTGPATQIEDPGQSWTWGGVGRQIAGALPRIGANVANVISDPYANLIGLPLTVAGQTAYDFLAPKLGYNQLTPQRRNMLYADFADQSALIGQRGVKAVGQAVEAVTGPGGLNLLTPGMPDPWNLPGTPIEKGVGSVVEGAGTAALLGPKGVAVPVAGGVGAATGEVASANVADWAKPGAGLAGNVAGAVATGAATTAQRTARGAVTDVSAVDATLGKLAKDKYGIPIDAPDLSSNPFYRITSDQASKLPFSGAPKAAAAKHEKWQGAIAKEMGENATAFTSDVMDRAATRIGAEFDRVANATSIDQPSVNTMIGDLAVIERDMNQVLPTNELPKIKAQLDNIVDVASKQNGTISGASYQALTRKNAPLDLAERSADPNVRHVAGQIRDALDDAFVRSASPTDQAALVQAKYQYRIMRTIDQLVAKSRDGNITPAGFMEKVVTASRKFDSPTGGIAYTGGGNIGELAKIGNLMRPAPQTGTADRALVNALAVGGTASPFFFDPASMTIVPLALAANRAGGSYLRSGGLADRVMRNALQPPPPSPFVLGAPIVTGTPDPTR